MNTKASALKANAAQAASYLKKLAHPQRLLLACQLLQGPQCVGELAELLGLRQATTSQHLAQLKADGIVTAARDGQTIYYELASGAARKILEALHQHFCKEKT